jgi:uncharacterized membrane protein YbaN (DUF454 family)
MLSEQGKKLVWRVLRLTAGWSLIAVGIVGLFLPFLQGILLIVSGLAVLSTESRWAKVLLQRFSAWMKARRGDNGSS